MWYIEISGPSAPRLTGSGLRPRCMAPRRCLLESFIRNRGEYLRPRFPGHTRGRPRPLSLEPHSVRVACTWIGLHTSLKASLISLSPRIVGYEGDRCWELELGSACVIGEGDLHALQNWPSALYGSFRQGGAFCSLAALQWDPGDTPPRPIALGSVIVPRPSWLPFVTRATGRSCRLDGRDRVWRV